LSSLDSDLVIVGGGPAGLATAIAARQQGLAALVVDRAAPPIDKACGEGLMPSGVAALAALGVTVDAECARPFRGIRYLGDGISVRADFPGAHGMALRRPVLHGLLHRRALVLGVQFAWRTPVRGLVGATARIDGGEISGRWLIGADGLHSRVRRWCGLETTSQRRPRFGVRRHYRLTPWSEDVEVYWAERAEAYVWGASAAEVGVAMLWSGGKSDFDSLLDRFPDLAQRLDGAAQTTSDQGAGPFDQRPRAVCHGPVALVGDAAGYRDAITGEGLSLAFHQALALAACLAADDLDSYPAALERLAARPYRFIRLLLAAEARPALRRRLLRLLAARPDLFRRLLAAHSGAPPLRAIGWKGLAQFAAGLLAPLRRGLH
jgi:flavin-dependent dehydrogenase